MLQVGWFEHVRVIFYMKMKVYINFLLVFSLLLPVVYLPQDFRAYCLLRTVYSENVCSIRVFDYLGYKKPKSKLGYNNKIKMG